MTDDLNLRKLIVTIDIELNFDNKKYWKNNLSTNSFTHCRLVPIIINPDYINHKINCIAMHKILIILIPLILLSMILNNF